MRKNILSYLQNNSLELRKKFNLLDLFYAEKPDRIVMVSENDIDLKSVEFNGAELPVEVVIRDINVEKQKLEEAKKQPRARKSKKGETEVPLNDNKDETSKDGKTLKDGETPRDGKKYKAFQEEVPRPRRKRLEELDDSEKTILLESMTLEEKRILGIQDGIGPQSFNSLSKKDYKRFMARHNKLKIGE